MGTVTPGNRAVNSFRGDRRTATRLAAIANSLAECSGRLAQKAISKTFERRSDGPEERPVALSIRTILRRLGGLSRRLIRLRPTSMLGHSKPRASDDLSEPSRLALGHLELSVMEVLWEAGESSVGDVRGRLNRPLAYTTVMTTLERLFKKALLVRRKVARAFVYSPRFSRVEWEHRRMDELVSAFVDASRPCRELFLSSLVDSVGEHDQALLDALEKKIQARRVQLSKRIRR
jgi:predicted transcriptional regulator